MPNGPPSRYEWDELTKRIDRMDARGTQGAGSFQTRLETVERQLAALLEAATEEKRERKATRRWMVGAAFTAAAVATTLATFIATYVFHAR